MSFGEQVIVKQTAAAMYDPIYLKSNEELHFVKSGDLSGAENIALQIWDGEGYVDHDLDVGGGITEITASINQMHIRAPGQYRLNKSASASAAGCYMYRTTY